MTLTVAGAGIIARGPLHYPPNLAVSISSYPFADFATGSLCPNLIERDRCKAKDCPDDCVVSEWSQWSSCSKSCGGGIQSRTRELLQASSTGASCGPMVQTRACSTAPCPVGCVLSSFSEWTPCSASCGSGYSARSRTVITPPSNGGRYRFAVSACAHCVMTDLVARFSRRLTVVRLVQLTAK